MASRLFRIKKWKTQVSLFLPLFFLLISLSLIGFCRFQNPFLQQFKMALIETVTPVVYVISSPIRWGKSTAFAVSDFINTYQNNRRLRAEKSELEIWRQKALKLQAEQETLHQLLNYTPPPKTTQITANVLTDNGGRYAHSLIVSAGAQEGVHKGDVAMTGSGVLGRVIDVGRHFSRLMLLTDYASRVPVFVGPNKINGVLIGDGSLLPKLTSLPENKTVSIGDVVLSSGQVGVYPSGLSIGVVASIDNGDIQVRLFEENMTPDLVRLVNFGISSVLLSDACSAEE